MERDIRITLCQMQVKHDKQLNIDAACGMLDAAAAERADIAVLPEMFNCPYDKRFFREYSENETSGMTLEAIAGKARSHGIYVAAGSIPEEDDGKIYNTSYFFGTDGSILGKHRKLHLFDIDIKDRIRFMESEVLTAGNNITVFDTSLCRVGLGVCYDIRFPELSRSMALSGAEILIFPGAFNMVTGPAHWELLVRTRALDNQVYVAAVSPARDENAGYIAYGYSMLADPWGNQVCRLDEKPGIFTCVADKEVLEKTRRELPLLHHRRNDVYKLFPPESK